MDIKEFISSGILELYTAGQLSNEEASEVELKIRLNPEIRSEYEKIQGALYVTAFNKLRSPSARVKESLMKKVASPLISTLPMNPVNKKNYTYKYLLAASLIFLMASLVSNFFLWEKLKDAKFQISAMSDQRKLMIQEYEAVSRKLSLAAADMEIMKDRSYKMIDMKGLDRSPNSNVMAFWNPKTKKVYVGVMNLPVPPSDKQYQLWALSNGKPIDAGVMDVDPSDKSLHEMKSMADAQAFAITLEPKGGSMSPTMDQMYVMGEV